MTTDIASEAVPGQSSETGEQQSVETIELLPTEAPDGAPAEPRRRRKVALLLFLIAALGGLLLFSGWYLINRKPVTELPLPGVTAEALPHYEFSVYGVVAPTGVAVSPDGSRIYVTQTEQGAKVLILDRDGKQLGAVTPPSTTGSDHVPVYVALNPTNGDLFVSDRPTGSIYVFSADGVFRRTFDPGSDLAGWQPLGLAFDSKGDLYVTDVSGPYNSLHVFGPDGHLIRSIGKAGDLNFPNGVAVDARGYIYVSDSNDGRLLVFDQAGSQLGVVARGAGEGNLGLPRGAAIDGDGRVYVVDTSAQNVQVYHLLAEGQRSPKYIGKFGVAGTGDGGFQYPNGVAVDARARVYVTDWRNNRVQVWTY